MTGVEDSRINIPLRVEMASEAEKRHTKENPEQHGEVVDPARLGVKTEEPGRVVSIWHKNARLLNQRSAARYSTTVGCCSIASAMADWKSE